MRLSLPRLKMPRLPGFSILVWISTALKGWVMGSREKDTDSLIMYDRTLLWLTFGLAAIGVIMVTSASMPIPRAKPRTNAVLPAPSSPKSATTEPTSTVFASEKPIFSVSLALRE